MSPASSSRCCRTAGAQIRWSVARASAKPRQLMTAPNSKDHGRHVEPEGQRRRGCEDGEAEAHGGAGGVAYGRRGDRREARARSRRFPSNPCLRTPPRELRWLVDGGRGARPAGGEQGGLVPAMPPEEGGHRRGGSLQAGGRRRAAEEGVVQRRRGTG
jgi:hypothetical protein